MTTRCIRKEWLVTQPPVLKAPSQATKETPWSSHVSSSSKPVLLSHLQSRILSVLRNSLSWVAFLVSNVFEILEVPVFSYFLSPQVPVIPLITFHQLQPSPPHLFNSLSLYIIPSFISLSPKAGSRATFQRWCKISRWCTFSTHEEVILQ